MKTLLLMRHAKSSWENANLSDFERTLNERGLHAAPKIGEYLKDNQSAPDLILSSPAFRAKETAEIVVQAAQWKSAITFESRIYEASVGTLYEILQEIESQVNTVFLVGHNSGLEDLIGNLTGEIHIFPTAALAKINLAIDDWKDLQPLCGKLESLIKPKEFE